jgi:hypothetical protein
MRSFVFGGVLYYTSPDDVRLRVHLLDLIRAHRQRCARGETATLFRYRDNFRRITRERPVSALVVCLASGPREMRQLAIWLLGRMGNRRTVAAIAQLGRDPDPSVRKEVAKALRRLDGWRYLRAMAETDPHPRVRRYANEEPPKLFPDRLRRYLADDVRRTGAKSDSQAPLPQSTVATVTLDGRPPKSSWFIARVLRRIHCLVLKGSPREVLRVRGR